MFHSLLKLLGKAGQDIQHGASNVVNNVTHPQSIVNNVAHDVQGAGNALHALLGRPPQAQAPRQAFGAPLSISNGVQNPTALPNVVANLQMQHALDAWGATPELRNIANQTIVRGHQPGDPAPWQQPGAPRNNSMSQGTFAQPNQQTNSRGGQVVLAERGNDPYIAIHELLHNAFARKTPAAQQQFLNLAQQNASPENRATISEHPYSQADSGQNIAQFPYSAAQEAHSMLPEVPQALNPALSRYYGQYISGNPYQELNTKYAVANASGFNPFHPGYPIPSPQFSDWNQN